MPHQHPKPTTVAILGPNTLTDFILARLLQREGYDTKLLGAYHAGPIDELLDGVNVVLLSSTLDADLRGTFLNAMRSNTRVAQRIPVLSLSVPLQVALQDELAVNVSWQSLFEELVQEIEAALTRTAASTHELRVPVDAAEPPKEIPSSTEVA